ncbi:MAG: hypothetical protein HQK54_13150 [Oligoflexales bacterium]|nr:hypothetical protein [Oligoflexales bacterium]
MSGSTIDFNNDASGKLPEGWTEGVTGPGEFKWLVEQDATAPSYPNVLKQSGNGKYPFCVRKDIQIEDGALEVKFKAVSGKIDQAGGLVWRWKDGDNYYITRANALEDNVTIYHTINGKREKIQVAGVRVESGKWHTLKVAFKGNQYEVSFNNVVVLSGIDDTIRGAGAVGLWTKADSVTLFDDFTYDRE